MRRLIRWTARFYPKAWRERYGAEFDALLEDMSPSFGDVCDVFRDVLRARVSMPVESGLRLASASGSSITVRLPVALSLSVHGVLVMIFFAAAVGYVSPMPLHRAIAPLPPPVPEAPPQMTDARVFPEAWTLYSSLPLTDAREGELAVYVADGIGINFFPLPDIGAVYRQGNEEWRVWPGQALESFIVRRVLPEFPRDADTRGNVSVFVEYLIRRDGSVKVLRTAGPSPFSNAARSAIGQWRYRPLEFEDQRCNVVSRLEVRFDGRFVQDDVR
jgi:Gram-negative bacterial TonB protein C-terminal